MSASPLPPEYRRDDWPRLVASKVNGHESRISTLEAGGGSGISTGKAMALAAAAYSM